MGPGLAGAGAVFEAERPRLLGLAYRITGSRTDAEDIVQESWVRWQQSDAQLDSPPAWLTTVTSRIALDHLRSAQHQRETYVGPWLPEPVTTEPGPEEAAELAESLTLGFLALLERLGPVERVVFLLADVFAVPFDEIAVVVDRSAEACRQVASRARRRVREDRHRYEPTDDEGWQLAAAFLAAARAGDIEALLEMLSPDAVAVSDGGRDHHAARRPVVSAPRVARLIANIASRELPGVEVELDIRPINGQPGIVLRIEGRAAWANAVDILDGKVVGIYSIVNPAKLAALDLPPIP